MMRREVTVKEVDIGCVACGIPHDRPVDVVAVAGMLTGLMSPTIRLCTTHLKMWKKAVAGFEQAAPVSSPDGGSNG